jgi:hypothetical protein
VKLIARLKQTLNEMIEANDLRGDMLTGIMRLYRRIGEWRQSYEQQDQNEIDSFAQWVGEYLEIYGRPNAPDQVRSLAFYQIQVPRISPKEVRRLKGPAPAELLRIFEEIFHIGQVLKRQYDQGQPLDFRPYAKFDKLYRQALESGSFNDAIFGG